MRFVQTCFLFIRSLFISVTVIREQLRRASRVEPAQLSGLQKACSSRPSLACPSISCERPKPKLTRLSRPRPRSTADGIGCHESSLHDQTGGPTRPPSVPFESCLVPIVSHFEPPRLTFQTNPAPAV